MCLNDEQTWIPTAQSVSPRSLQKGRVKPLSLLLLPPGPGPVRAELQPLLCKFFLVHTCLASFLRAPFPLCWGLLTVTPLPGRVQGPSMWLGAPSPHPTLPDPANEPAWHLLADTWELLSFGEHSSSSCVAILQTERSPVLIWLFFPNNKQSSHYR